MNEKTIHFQKGKGTTPWPLRRRLAILGWGLVWPILCYWTPKPFGPWRNLILRLAGARVARTAFVHQRARIEQPWNLELADGCSIGDRVNLYSLGMIRIGQGVVIGPEVFLCTGTHDFESDILSLVTSAIHIEDGAFIGARAFIAPGVTVGANAIVGAMSVCTKDVPENAVVAGNPAKPLRMRSVRH